MYSDATRRLELLRPARLGIFDNRRLKNCNYISTSLENQLINIEEAGCSKNAWCSLEKIFLSQ